MSAHQHHVSDAVAIVGMACRLPGARDLDAFWRLLCDGRDALTHFTEHDLLAAGVDPALVSDPAYVRAGMVLDDVDKFDAEFFGVPAPEAAIMDPQQRVLLECAWHALEDAGIAGAPSAARVGVYAGGRVSDYLLFYQGPPDLFGHFEPSPLEGLRRITLNDKDYLATRLAYVLDLRGPAVTVQTACSTSLVAAHLACQALLRGECDVALAGGVSIRVPQQAGYKFTEGMIFPPDGRTRPFDANASGPIVGSGVGMVVLRRLEDALASSDRIYAVIRGSAINNDGGVGKAAFTGPSLDGQRRVIGDALAVADVDSRSVSYVEAHGTSTRVGDPVEIAALAAAFGPPNGAAPCAIGSVKSNIGHLFQAAGVSGLIKAALMLHHKTLVPSVNFEQPNPLIDFATAGFAVNTERRSWPNGGGPLRAGVSAFGFGGTNAHVVLEEAPVDHRTRAAARPPSAVARLLPISTKSASALRVLAERYLAFLDDEGAGDIGAICATAQLGRRHFAHRLAAVGRTASGLRASLAARLADREAIADAPHATRNKVAFLFTGQGGQYAGMGRRLYEHQPVFRDVIDRSAEMLKGELDVPLHDILYGPAAEGLLSRTDYAQPALVAMEAALAALWRSWGVEPRVVIGHSIGELAAASVNGVMSLEDALRLAVVRGRLMHRTASGRMATVFAADAVVIPVVNAQAGAVTLAALNGREQTVLAGSADAIRQALEACEAHGLAARQLPGTYAFHSTLMEPVLDDLQAAAGHLTMRPPAPQTFVSTLTGTFAGSELVSPEYWRRQAREPVQFGAALAVAIAAGCNVFIEIGPDAVLTNLGRATYQDAEFVWRASVKRGADDVEQCLSALAALYEIGLDVAWTGVSQPAERVSIPAYPFERTRFWVEGSARRVAPMETEAGGHPLLGRRLSSPLNEIQFQSELTANVGSFASDHWIYGSRPLVLVGQLEMARAAAADVFNDASGSIVLDNVVVERPLLLSDERRRVQTIVTPCGDRMADVAIFSASGPHGRWLCHSRMRASQTPAAGNARHVDTADIRQRCPDVITGAEIHARKRAKGAPIGPGFAIVPRAWRGSAEVLAEVVLREEDREDAQRYGAFPGIVDAVAQCADLTFDDAAATPRSLFLPTIVERVEFLGPLRDGGWAYIRRRQGANDEVYGVDAEVADTSGRVLLEVSGLFFKRATPGALRAHEDATVQTFEVVWTPVKRPAGEQPLTGMWLVFADRGGVAASVVRRIEARGGRCIVATEDEAESEGLQSLFARARDGACRGILALWCLDHADTDAHPLDVARATCGRMLLVVQAMLAQGIDVPLRIVTRGAQTTGRETSPLMPGQATLWGFARALQREQPAMRCDLLDLDPSGLDDADALMAALANVEAETELAVRGDAMYASRLRAIEPPPHEPAAPYAFVPSADRTLESLSPTPLVRRPPGPGEVEIEVFASGLNFRDALNATGRIDGPLGYECSGRITAVGTGAERLEVGMPVIALATNGFSSHVTLDHRCVVEKPSHVSPIAAAGLPVAYVTAYYALIERGMLGAGQTVVVHSAAGGVGLAAIQIARAVGARVFATASRSKWPFVRSQGVEHVLDSRVPGYSREVLRLTGGQRVDMVLNTLGPEFTQDHLNVLRPGGRFIELGHPRIHDLDGPAKLASERGIEFINFHIAQDVGARDPDRLLAMLGTISEWLSSGRVHPLPCRQVRLGELRGAFETMLRGGHIGKIVAVHPAAFPALEPGINGHSTYLITGGLGGVGLQIANGLVGAGARHLVLLARRAPSASAIAQIRHLEQQGASVRVIAADVADEAAVHAALEELQRDFPPLAGIVHAAGVTDDGVVSQHSWERFATVLSPKIAGAWNLHTLTSGLPLDFFVVIASSAGLLGNAGQSNYAAANAWLDQFAHYRRQRGLPATSVDLGLIGGPGMGASLSAAARERHRARGVTEIDPARAVEALMRCVVEDRTQAAALAIDWGPYLSEFGGTTPSIFRDLASARAVQSEAASRQLSPTRPRPLTTEEMLERMKFHVGALAGHGRAIDVDRTLPELGLDSLSVLLLRGRLVAELGADCAPPVVAFLERRTIGQLAALAFERARQREPLRADERVETDAASVSASPPQRCLTVLRRSGSGQPVFLIPPAGRSVIPLMALAQSIDADCPVYGFNPVGFDGKSPAQSRVEDMAARYVEELLLEFPRGPYVLGGMCFGGMVAWEMAKQLRAHDRKIALLIVLDAGAPVLDVGDLSPADVLTYSLHRVLHHLTSGSTVDAAAAFWERRRVARRGEAGLFRRQSAASAAISETVRNAHRVAAATYRATRAPLPVIVLQSGDYRRAAVHRWRMLTGNRVEVITFEGTSHVDLLSERSAPRLGDAIADRLRTRPSGS